MDKLKLRLKLNEYEFEAEGPHKIVNLHLKEFETLCQKMADKSYRSFSEADRVTPLLGPAGSSLDNHLTAKTNNYPYSKLFTIDQKTSLITCKILPSGEQKNANIVLLLLLGYLLLQNQTEVPALVLNRSLRSISAIKIRLDRLLNSYLRKRMIMKSGLGKGGRYRLTTPGIQEAKEKAMELIEFIPE